MWFCLDCRLLCFVQAKTLYKYGWMYVLTALVVVCVDMIMMVSEGCVCLASPGVIMYELNYGRGYVGL